MPGYASPIHLQPVLTPPNIDNLDRLLAAQRRFVIHWLFAAAPVTYRTSEPEPATSVLATPVLHNSVSRLAGCRAQAKCRRQGSPKRCPAIFNGSADALGGLDSSVPGGPPACCRG